VDGLLNDFKVEMLTPVLERATLTSYYILVS